MKIKQIKATYNYDAVSKYPNVTGAVEIYEVYENGETEYGKDYISFKSELDGRLFKQKVNSANIKTYEELDKIIQTML